MVPSHQRPTWTNAERPCYNSEPVYKFLEHPAMWEPSSTCIYLSMPTSTSYSFSNVQDAWKYADGVGTDVPSPTTDSSTDTHKTAQRHHSYISSPDSTKSHSTFGKTTSFHQQHINWMLPKGQQPSPTHHHNSIGNRTFPNRTHQHHQRLASASTLPA